MERNSDMFNLYPNPAKDEIFVTIGNGADYRIFDVKGSLILTGKFKKSLKLAKRRGLNLELLDEVNAYRVSVGLNPLQIIEHISYKSSEHNDYMLATHTVTHEGFEERKSNLQEVLGAYRVGENVAYAYSSAQSTVNAWVNSPSHKANLEGDYTHFGASIKTDEQGRKYYTNMFIKK